MLAEHVGRPWAAEDTVGARGIDPCGSAFGVVMVAEKKEACNGICRECAHSCTKMGAPFYSKIKKSCRLCYQGTMYRATHGGVLQDVEPGLVRSLPAGKRRQSWYANLVPDY